MSTTQDTGRPCVNVALKSRAAYAAGMGAMTTETLKSLADELAFGYFTPEELATRYDLPAPQILKLAENSEFSKLVLDARKGVDEKGHKTRLMARKLVAELVPEVARMVVNQQAEYADRLNAFKQLVAIAQITNEDTGQAGSGFAVNIQINNG